MLSGQTEIGPSCYYSDPYAVLRNRLRSPSETVSLMATARISSVEARAVLKDQRVSVVPTGLVDYCLDKHMLFFYSLY